MCSSSTPTRCCSISMVAGPMGPGPNGSSSYLRPELLVLDDFGLKPSGRSRPRPTSMMS